MGYYVGIDVSLKEVFISILDSSGKVMKEGAVKNEPKFISKYLLDYKGSYEKIGLEAGQFSIYLCKELRKLGYEVICVDARHMAAGLSARINKNDRNDARGIANMLRASLYKEVYIKSDSECEQKILLQSRKQVVWQRLQLRSTIRGLLKIYGYTLSGNLSDKKFTKAVQDISLGLADVIKASLMGLLKVLESLTEVLKELDGELVKLAKELEDCRLLLTIPGVGIITAMTYISTIGDPKRFNDSQLVGAYLGLTPKQYASGAVNRQGSISRMGSSQCRAMLYEAAFCLLTRSKRTCAIRTWGLKIAKKKGTRKAVVAVARRLSVTMHRMLVTKTEFCAEGV
jgi:transposase